MVVAVEVHPVVSWMNTKADSLVDEADSPKMQGLRTSRFFTRPPNSGDGFCCVLMPVRGPLDCLSRKRASGDQVADEPNREQAEA